MIKNKKKALLLTVILISTIAFAGCGKNTGASASNEQVIRIGTSGGYYPFTFMKDDKLQGFEIDVWNEIGKRIGYKVDFETAAFDGLFGMLDTGKIDTIANQITITDARKQKYLFTTPYVYTGAQLVVNKGNNSIQSLNDLKGKKIGVDLGSNFEQIVRNFDKNNEINVITYQGAGAYQDLAIGRIDALMIDKVSALATINEQKLNLQLAGGIVEPIENAFPFANNDKNKELIVRINKAIDAMRTDGTLAKISSKWMGADITKK